MNRDDPDAHRQDTDVAELDERAVFGSKLKAAREERNLSVKDLVHLTRISPPFVEALESGAFELLPGRVFGRGFTRNICRVLELDPAPFLDDFDKCWPGEEGEHSSVRRASGSRTNLASAVRRRRSAFSRVIRAVSPRFLVRWALVAVIAVTAGAGTWHLLRDRDGSFHPPASEISQQEKPTEVPDVVADESVENPTSTASATDPVASVGSVEASEPVPESSPEEIAVEHAGGSGENQLFVSVLEKVEMKITIDGVTQRDSLEPGRYRYHFGTRIDLFVPNTDAIRIHFRDREVDDLAAYGTSRHLSFVSGGLPETVHQL